MNISKILLVLILAFTSASAQAEKKAALSQGERYKNLELFQRVLHFVEDNYVDDVNNTDLVHGAIQGMLQTLDPHSSFLPPNVFKEMRTDTSGKFGGLGIEIGLRNGVLTVIAPIEDTPAWKAGIKPGDRIIKIEGDSTKGMTLEQAVAKMRGQKGSKVRIAIYRNGFEETRDVEIVRDTIKVRAVKKDTLEPGYDYIRLTSFNEQASAEIEKALKSFEKKDGKIKGLVFDLRNNPGGLLEQAVEVSSLFISEGIVVSTVGRNKDKTDVKHARTGKSRNGFPVAILVNSATASAAEIVAGALQDHRRAVVMGEPTFGKGSVQTVIELGDKKDMGLKLTIARYYTPSGRNIQEEGVMPDILLDQYDPSLLAKARIESKFIREKDLPGHIAGRKSEKRPHFSMDELQNLETTDSNSESDKGKKDMEPTRFDPKTDYQVQEALNYIKSFEIFKKLTPPPVTEVSDSGQKP